MTSRTEKFQRKPREKEVEKLEVPEEVIRFSPEEEAVGVPCVVLHYWMLTEDRLSSRNQMP